MKIPNLLIIAGTGNKSGKTSMVCRLIEQFRELNIIAVKITPHFHDITPGLRTLRTGSFYSVFRETDNESSKDTSRMLRAGASEVYFAKVTDDTLAKAFNEILGIIPEGSPIICESPALRYYFEPGLFIVMTSGYEYNKKDISSLIELPHVEFDLRFLRTGKKIPVYFKNGEWTSKS
jgi:hypothetical protein